LRIHDNISHDILMWIRIRIRGSMPLTNGSGSFYQTKKGPSMQVRCFYFNHRLKIGMISNIFADGAIFLNPLVRINRALNAKPLSSALLEIIRAYHKKALRRTGTFKST
jgi:hypothetical protein